MSEKQTMLLRTAIQLISEEGVVQSVATYAVRHKLPDPMVKKLTKRSFDLFWKGITL